MVTSGTTSFEERVGRVLLDAEFVSVEQLEQARKESLERGEGLLDTLVSLGIVAGETLTTILSFQLKIPVVDLKSVQVDPDAVVLVPEKSSRARTTSFPWDSKPTAHFELPPRCPTTFSSPPGYRRSLAARRNSPSR